MRVCQVCNHNGKRVIFNHYDGELCLFECTACGHRYVDGLVDQAWFDNFYLTRYTTDDKDFSGARLASLADCIASYECKQVLDIGGMDGELRQHLDDRKVYAYLSGVGGDESGPYCAVILSHTLEHIYDINAMFERVKRCLRYKDLLFVEIPVHLNYQEPTQYDYHFQHVNKFRPQDIEALLFLRHGFTIEVSEQLPDYREYNCWRIVGRNG